MKKVVVCFDMDGTLVDLDRPIHPTDVALLRALNENLTFIPVTGRPLESIRATFELASLWRGQKIPLPMVLHNGSVMYLPAEKILKQNTFAPDLQEELVRLAQEMIPFETTVYLYDVDTVYYQNWLEEWIQFLHDYHIVPKPYPGSAAHLKFFKMTAHSNNPDALQKMAKKLRTLPVDFSFNMGRVIEITPRGVNKGTSLQELVQALYPRDEVMILAAGDSNNDVSMFKVADQSFTFSTSFPEVRAQANHILDSFAEGLFTPMLRWAGVAVKS